MRLAFVLLVVLGIGFVLTRMPGACGVIGVVGFTAGLAALLVTIVCFNVRRLRTIRVVQSLPESVVKRVLDLVDQAGRDDGSHVVLLRMSPAARDDVYSCLGSTPRVPAGMALPAGVSGQGCVFLGQVRLQSPPLPPGWSNRIAFLFREAPWKLRAVSIAGAAPGTEDAMTDTMAGDGWGLSPLFLPLGDTLDNHPVDEVPCSPYAPRLLVRRVPELRQLLAAYPERPERLLPYILVPGIATHEIDTFLVNLMGGDPELIQGEHGASCPECSLPMRFLFQLGDVLGLGGDAPVVYVYGCDAHPVTLQAFVDMH
jgi:hypothetical protein